jgi:hypothetical protein
MAEEWRLSIDFAGHPGAGRRFYRGRRVRAALRSRVGGNVAISAESGCVFLYTEHAGVATEAELAARQILAQRSPSAGIRLDRWDPSDQVWRNARSNEPEQDAAPLAAAAGSPGRAPMSAAMVEALSSMIAAGLDVIGMIP